MTIGMQCPPVSRYSGVVEDYSSDEDRSTRHCPPPHAVIQPNVDIMQPMKPIVNQDDFPAHNRRSNPRRARRGSGRPERPISLASQDSGFCSAPDESHLGVPAQSNHRSTYHEIEYGEDVAHAQMRHHGSTPSGPSFYACLSKSEYAPRGQGLNNMSPYRRPLYPPEDPFASRRYNDFRISTGHSEHTYNPFVGQINPFSPHSAPNSAMLFDPRTPTTKIESQQRYGNPASAKDNHGARSRRKCPSKPSVRRTSSVYLECPASADDEQSEDEDLCVADHVLRSSTTKRVRAIHPGHGRTIGAHPYLPTSLSPSSLMMNKERSVSFADVMHNKYPLHHPVNRTPDLPWTRQENKRDRLINERRRHESDASDIWVYREDSDEFDHSRLRSGDENKIGASPQTHKTPRPPKKVEKTQKLHQSDIFKPVILRDLVDEMVKRYVTGKDQDHASSTRANPRSKKSQHVRARQSSASPRSNAFSSKSHAICHFADPEKPGEKTAHSEPLNNVHSVKTANARLPGSDIPSISLENSETSLLHDTKDEGYGFLGRNRNLDKASDADGSGIQNALGTAMNKIKSLLLRGLMDAALSGSSITVASSASPESVSQSGSISAARPSSASSGTSSSSSQSAQRRKRTRDTDRSPGDDGNDSNSSEDDDRPKKKTGPSTPDRTAARRLKCPFHQREPEKYLKASCRGAGFADMAKLKDHIKRVHMQPLRCARCWLEMESDGAYDEHMQQDSMCEKRPEPHDDRIRPQTLKQLDFKKAPYASAKSTEEKWRMLFSVLFPDESNIPSPYEQQGISPRLARALSNALEEELTCELAPILNPIMDRIKALIPAIIEKCRLELLRSSPEETMTFTTTPTIVSTVGSSDGESWNHGTHCDSPPSSHSSRSSLDITPVTPNVMYGGASRKPSEQFTLSSNPFGRIGRGDYTSFECNTQPTSWCPTSQYGMPTVLRSDVFDALATESQHDRSFDPDSLFSDQLQGGPHASFTTPAFSHKHYPGGNHILNETPLDLVCDGDFARPSLLGGLQSRSLMFVTGDQELLSNWDPMMKEFDFPSAGDA